MGIIIGIIIGVVAILALVGFTQESQGKAQASASVSKVATERNVGESYISLGGSLSFLDEESKVIDYHNRTSSYTEIDYSDIIQYKKHTGLAGVAFYAFAPDYREFQSGDVGANKINALTNKLDHIIQNNYNAAIREYSDLVELPTNAATVTIKEVSGCSLFIPEVIGKWGTAYLWTIDEKICLFPAFKDLADFRLNRSAYQVIEIDKNSIVGITQEGSVHYTTEVHGGGGGGSSITGAIIGGAIAGEAGAIIGSRKEVKAVESTTKQIDDRTTRIKILDAANNFFEIAFDYNNYYAISKLVGK